MLKIAAANRSYWSNPANAGPEGPLERSRSFLRGMFDNNLNAVASRRILEPRSVLLLNGMADELRCRRTLQNRRKRTGVVAVGLFRKLAGVASGALCRPGEVAGPEADRQQRN